MAIFEILFFGVGFLAAIVALIVPRPRDVVRLIILAFLFTSWGLVTALKDAVARVESGDLAGFHDIYPALQPCYAFGSLAAVLLCFGAYLKAFRVRREPQSRRTDDPA